jgi:hypothetical protein
MGNAHTLVGAKSTGVSAGRGQTNDTDAPNVGEILAHLSDDEWLLKHARRLQVR